MFVCMAQGCLQHLAGILSEPVCVRARGGTERQESRRSLSSKADCTCDTSVYFAGEEALGVDGGQAQHLLQCVHCGCACTISGLEHTQ